MLKVETSNNTNSGKTALPSWLILMMLTRRENAEGRRSREMDILSNYDNMDVMLDGETINSVN